MDAERAKEKKNVEFPGASMFDLCDELEELIGPLPESFFHCRSSSSSILELPAGDPCSELEELLGRPPDHLFNLSSTSSNAAESSSMVDPEADDAERLRSRVWSDIVRLKQLREQKRKMMQQSDASAESSSFPEKYRRKKLTRIQERILDDMLQLVRDGHAQGFVYGIIPSRGKPVSGASHNLRGWWKDTVRFDRSGPAAIGRHQKESPGRMAKNEICPDFSVLEALQELQDTTLASMLSALMPYCDPPQRRFPLERGVPPPWWPSMAEEWWREVGPPRDPCPPPYKKPHDLKKAWKVSVMVSVVKHLMPGVDKIRRVLEKSKGLQDRITAREVVALEAVLRHELKRYKELHVRSPPPPPPSVEQPAPDVKKIAGGGWDMEVYEQTRSQQQQQYKATGVVMNQVSVQEALNITGGVVELIGAKNFSVERISGERMDMSSTSNYSSIMEEPTALPGGELDAFLDLEEYDWEVPGD